VVLFAAGMLFAAPGNETLGVTHLQLSMAAIVLALPPITYAWTRHRER